MNKALTLGVAAVAITAGTYFVLHTIAPQRHVEEKRQQEGPTVDDVFAGKLDLAALDSDAPPAAPAPAAEAPVAETPAADTAATEEAAPVDASAEPAPGEAAEAPSGDVDAASGDMGATEVAAAPAPAAAEPAPAAVEPPPAAEPAPAPAPAAEAPKPKAQAPVKAEAPKPAAKPAEKKKPTPAKASGPWWGASSPSGLSLEYAGSAAYKKAVVLMFSGTFDSADSANKNIKVKDASGKVVSGKWELGPTNKKMLVLPVQKNGTYTVSVGNGLADRNNRTLGKKLSGPVKVQ
ncbi:hypothetical protein D0B54_11970 [Solimonas sp. K1W22B-7]|uniref:hypothetical protein n=1 Tax=Solimonas sp. K1W22B-7 TaxID=2303331 RepID=UPI000E333C6D|nr:hypothetical protein [Solimonas sp. K1W22B-7]AXQ29366.1 hypothetical protein D0B54_11970 [Solimonas sp. K1W22B-7]